MEIQEAQASKEDGPKFSKSFNEFLDWVKVDKNQEDIEAHSGWIDKHYTQCEDFIIHPELGSFEDYETLYPSAVKGEWEEVLKICGKKLFLSTAPIINSLDTVFHLAISDDRKVIFEKLLQLLPQESLGIASALRRKNKKGNNLLHIAASVGSVTMCSLIIRISKSMINTYNNEGESPLFVAALHGHKEAFLYLHSECGPNEHYCIRNNGDTILHCAIAEEHHELCYKILHLYGGLVDFTNNKRITPLHLLANKPSAFKSGTDLRWYEEIIYSFVGTEKLEIIREAEKEHLRRQDTHGGINQRSNGAPWNHIHLPPIYGTCFEFVKLVFKAVSSSGRKCTPSEADIENAQGDPSPNGVEGHQLHPPNYGICFSFGKLVLKAMLIILGVPKKIEKVRMTKVRHEWSILIMNELLQNTSMYRFSKDIPSFLSYSMIPEHAKSINDGESIPYDLIPGCGLSEKSLRTQSSFNKKHKKDTEESVKSLNLVMPDQVTEDEKKKEDNESKEKSIEDEDIDLSELTPMLVAARNGIIEMVEKTLRKYPMAMYDVDKHQKNIVLLTAEHKQPSVYKLLLSLKEEKIIKESVFCAVDNEGNSALHLTAKSTNFDWPVPGALSKMQWEIKWYEYIQKSSQRNFHFVHNNKNQTPGKIFTKSHTKLVEEGRSWLNQTSNACSLVAGLFVTSTFSTVTNLNDAIKSNNKASKIYAGSSFVSFYTSLIAVVIFLAIPTSAYRKRNFRDALPKKLVLGLTAFYISLAFTLVSFTTGHFFIFRDQLKFLSSTSYIVIYALVTVFSMAVFPLYFHLVWASFKNEPQHKYRLNIPQWLLDD
ncbi:hypothetical protein ACB092_10G200200 [Castanea dentata]